MADSTVTDSIKKFPKAKVSELRMMLSTDANKDKHIMLIEGSDDRKFYGQFISDNHILMNVLDSCYYMHQILVMINSVDTLKDKVIGIKDADFDHITHKDYALDNLFVTDTHDWETMVIESKCENSISLEALDRKEVGLFEKVMKDLTDYSYIKLYNDVEICGNDLDGILFKGLSLERIYDGANSCRLDSCLSTVKSHGNNSRLTHFPTENDIERLKLCYSKMDLRQLTCGHDLIHGVVCRLQYLKGSSLNIGYNAIEMIFRVSCDLDYFKTTSLYHLVSSWAKKHGTVVWAA